MAITIVSLGSVVYASEYQTPYKIMYNVNEDDVIKTPFNDDTVPNDFSVESKEITGNEKHFLTWSNPEGFNYDDYKVEIYAKLYVEYKDTDGEKLSEVELENTPWRETSFPCIHCVDVDAIDGGTVVNYSDLKQSYDNVTWEHPNEDFERLRKLFASLDLWIVTGDQYPDYMSDFNKMEYWLRYGEACDYLRFGRVKYFARYVSKSSVSQELKPDEDGYYHYYYNYIPWVRNPNPTVREDGNVTYYSDRWYKGDIVKHEFKSKNRLFIELNGDYFEDIKTDNSNNPLCDVYSSAWSRLCDGIKKDKYGIMSSQSNEYDISNNFAMIYNEYTIFKNENYGWSSNVEYYRNKLCSEFNISDYHCVPVNTYSIDTNMLVVDNVYDENDEKIIRNWKDNGVYSYDIVTVGKFVENDTQITVKPTPTETPSATPEETKGPDVTEKPSGETAPASTPTSSPASTFTPLPSSSIKPNGTGNDYTDVDNNDNSDMSDVVHWLKMIYNRCGRMLEQIKIINTVVDKMNEIIENQKNMLSGFTDNADNNDVVKYLKKIYHVLIANFVENVIDDIMSYVTEFVSDIGNTVADVADTAYTTASKTFPLSVIFIPKIVFDTLASSPKTPYKKVSIKKPAGTICGVDVPEIKFEFVIDLKQFNELAAICRNCIVIVFLFGMVNYTTEVIGMINDTVGGNE